MPVMTSPSTASPRPNLLKALGPGFLFAGTAVGVSHLVQSTRAGAMYGLAMLGLVVVANVLKYPGFNFGPRYAAATGTSLLEAYRRQGKWALILYGVLTVGTMFAVQAAVTIVTAGLALALFGNGLSLMMYALVITVLGAGINGMGQFRLLDRVIKVIVVTLTIATLAATTLALGQIDWSSPWILGASDWDPKTVFFAAALVGWMPTALDIAVWHSLWTLARRDSTGHRPSVREVLVDFNIGYIGTALLALCYVLLGAGVMFGSGQQLATTAGGFANQVIDLYTQNLGEWSRPVIGFCALTVMCSTVLTVIDGFPRALSGLVARFQSPEQPEAGDQHKSSKSYWGALVILGVGSLLVLGQFIKNLKGMVDLATVLSFLTAPILAWMNHRAILGSEVPEAARPGRGMQAYSWVSIACLAAFALYYLKLRFLSG